MDASISPPSSNRWLYLSAALVLTAVVGVGSFFAYSAFTGGSTPAAPPVLSAADASADPEAAAAMISQAYADLTVSGSDKPVTIVDSMFTGADGTPQRVAIHVFAAPLSSQYNDIATRLQGDAPGTKYQWTVILKKPQTPRDWSYKYGCRNPSNLGLFPNRYGCVIEMRRAGDRNNLYVLTTIGNNDSPLVDSPDRRLWGEVTAKILRLVK